MNMNSAALSALLNGDTENFLVAATPGGIEAQEKAGQLALVGSTDMPIVMKPSRESFEKVGFKFGDEIDTVFLKAELPKCWTRAATDHSMHSDILDDQGRERVSVFYKAAFYDRRAHAYLNPRYTVDCVFLRENQQTPSEQVAYCVKDSGKEIYRTEPIGSTDWAADKKVRAFAEAWLQERFPNYEDPTAYWDAG
jgi:hypothetical protein